MNTTFNKNKMGMNVHLAGWSVDKTQTIDVLMPLLADAGVKIIRSDFFISVIEGTRGVFNFIYKDYLVQKATQYGIKILANIATHSSTDWSNGGHGNYSQYPVLPEFYGEFCQAIASHFKDKIVYYELGNEVDITAFWPPKPDGKAYTDTLIAGYKGIKSGSINTIVLTAGFTGFPVGLPSHFGSAEMLQAIYDNGGKNYFDGVGLHLYNLGSKSIPPSFSMVDACQAILNKNGDSKKKIYITEIGFHTGTSTDSVTESEQATRIEELYNPILSGKYTDIPFLCYYDFVDDGIDLANGEQNFGITHSSKFTTPYLPKPAYQSYKNLAKGIK